MENIDDLMEKLDLSLRSSAKMYYGKCLHGGATNTHALSVYKNTGLWYCMTKGCQTTFMSSLLGLVRFKLSVDMGWSSKGDKYVQFKDAVKWVGEFLGVDPYDIHVDSSKTDKEKFVRMVGAFQNVNRSFTMGVSREETRKRLIIPPEYLLRRGLEGNILDEYDVGLCQSKGKPMFNRVVFPVYNDEGKTVVGCVGRSVHQKCLSCGYYHEPKKECPTSEGEQYLASKWINSKNLKVSDHLYNYWRAKPQILEHGTVYLVEGPIDCLKMVQAGFTTTLALFGARLSDRQLIKLEQSGAMTLHVLTDADETGQEAAEDIKSRCERHFCLKFPVLPQGKKDVGELTVSELQELLGGRK